MQTLGEDLVLLAIGERTGRLANAARLRFGLMGSELVRLAAAGVICAEQGGLLGTRWRITDTARAADAGPGSTPSCTRAGRDTSQAAFAVLAAAVHAAHHAAAHSAGAGGGGHH